MLLINRKVLTFLALLFLLTVTLFSEGNEGAFQTENNRNVPGYLSSIAGGLQDAANWMFDYYRLDGSRSCIMKYASFIVMFLREYLLHRWHLNNYSYKSYLLLVPTLLFEVFFFTMYIQNMASMNIILN